MFYWPDGRTFEGSWRNGKQDGLVKYINSAGVLKYGEWENGVRKGWIEDPKEIQLMRERGLLNHLNSEIGKIAPS